MLYTPNEYSWRNTRILCIMQCGYSSLENYDIRVVNKDFGHKWGDSPMIFCVTGENHRRITSRGTKANVTHSTTYSIVYLRDYSRFAPSQWETPLLCNDISHWLGANLKSALYLICSCFVKNTGKMMQTPTDPSLRHCCSRWINQVR